MFSRIQRHKKKLLTVGGLLLATGWLGTSVYQYQAARIYDQELSSKATELKDYLAGAGKEVGSLTAASAVQLQAELKAMELDDELRVHNRLTGESTWSLDKEASLPRLQSLLDNKEVKALGFLDDQVYVSTATKRFSVPEKVLHLDGRDLATTMAQSMLTKTIADDKIPFTRGHFKDAGNVWTTLGSVLSGVLNVLFSLLMLAVVGMTVWPMLAARFMFGTVAERPTVKFSDVIGANEAKDALKEVSTYLKDPARYTASGVRPPKGVMMTGSPGVGKTMLAKALAGETGAAFIAVSASDFKDSYVGGGIRRVKAAFASARKHAPCILFIDEADSLGKRSFGGQPSAAEREYNATINQMLVEMDGFNSAAGVIVIGATNHMESLDPALIREGRMDRKCHVALPGLDDRAALYQHYLSRYTLAGDIDYRRIARFSVDMSPAAIESVCNQAASEAMKDGLDEVHQKHVDHALDSNRMGAPNSAIVLDEETRELVAYHEAGHAVIGRLLRVGSVDKVTIQPRGQALGVTLVTKEKDEPLESETALLARVEMLLAGRCAEQLFCDKTTTGAGNDLQRASQLAYAMVSNYGFGQNGLFSLAAFEHGSAPESAVREAISEANFILTEAEERCRARLLEHSDAMHAIAQALIDHETIPGSLVIDHLEGKAA